MNSCRICSVRDLVHHLYLHCVPPPPPQWRICVRMMQNIILHECGRQKRQVFKCEEHFLLSTEFFFDNNAQITRVWVISIFSAVTFDLKIKLWIFRKQIRQSVDAMQSNASLTICLQPAESGYSLEISAKYIHSMLCCLCEIFHFTCTWRRSPLNKKFR